MADMVSLPGPDEPLYGIVEVATKIGVEKTTLWRMIKRGQFPRGRLIAGILRWSAADLAAWRLLADRWFPDSDQMKPEKQKKSRKNSSEPPPEQNSEKKP